MVLLANGGADVSRAGGSGGRSCAHDRFGADVGGRCLCTRYNRNIRRAAVVVGQRSLVADAAEGLGLLPLLRQRIRLKLRLVSGGSSIPLQHQLRAIPCELEGFRDGCCGMFADADYWFWWQPRDTTTHSFSPVAYEDFLPPV